MANKKALDLDQLKTSLSAVKNWTSGEITNATKNKADKDTVLLKDNTTEYIPTADYNPSTKKYVDDKITEVDKTFTGATSSTNGTNGLVPAPTKGNQSKYLKADGTWGTPTNTVYTHPTTAGNKHIPAGGASGNILKWSADGTAVWGDPDAAVSSFAIDATDPIIDAEPQIEFNNIDAQKGGFDYIYDLFKQYSFNIAIVTSESGKIFKLSYINNNIRICIFNGLIDKKTDITSGSITSKVIGTIICDDTTWSYAEKDVSKFDNAKYIGNYKNYDSRIIIDNLFESGEYYFTSSDIGSIGIIDLVGNCGIFLLKVINLGDIEYIKEKCKEDNAYYDDTLSDSNGQTSVVGTVQIIEQPGMMLSGHKPIYYYREYREEHFEAGQYSWTQWARCNDDQYKMDKSGGTMTGILQAQSNTAYTTYQVRNIAFSTSASVPTGNGSILGVYS